MPPPRLQKCMMMMMMLALQQLPFLATSALTTTTTTPTTTTSQQHYDYVIVGGGTAGLVIANRLSELRNVTVAVIEAGSSVLNNPNVTDPLAFTVAFGTDIDYDYTTVPQEFGGGLELAMHQGKALGGTSTINGMSYTRTESIQIDSWPALGNPSWTWTSLSPYYKKSETFAPPTTAQLLAGATSNPSYHGFHGPLKTGFLYGLMNGTIPAFINQTMQNLEIPLKDLNGGEMRGFSEMPQTIDRERNVREDAARAYYYPFYEGRGNLRVLMETTAVRVVWRDGEGDEEEEGKAVAEGVEVVDNNGTRSTIYADKEVILSAGSLRTPGLLERSGVGNPDILTPLNIPTKINLPSVGSNLQDQPNTVLQRQLLVNSTSPPLDATGFAEFVAYITPADIFPPSELLAISSTVKANISSYATLASSHINNSITAASFEKIFAIQHSLIFGPNNTNARKFPAAEVLLVPGAGSALTGGQGATVSSAYWGILPFARGSVHITSTDVDTKPRIDPAFFMAGWDVLQQVRTAQYIRKIFATEPLSKVLGEETIPGFGVVPENATDQQWAEWVLSGYTSNNHPVATTAMMAKDLGGVVDERLRVYGAKNVRIVDAGVIPFQLVGHLTSTIYALAERAADLIKEDIV